MVGLVSGWLVVFVLRMASAKLIHTQVLSRHCNRMPQAKISMSQCPVDIFEKLGLGRNEFTPLGEHQCFKLGEFLKRNYVDKIDGISKQYNSGDFYFHSSMVERTIRSMQSIGIGLFNGLGHSIDIDPQCESLPHRAQTIPIFNLADPDNDRVFFEYDMCPIIEERILDFLKTKEGLEVLAHLLPKFVKFSNVSGFEVTLKTFDSFGDTMMVLEDHHLLCDNLKTIFSEVVDVSHFLYDRVLYKKDLVENLAGGSFMKLVLDHFQKGHKFVHHSGHDSSIMNALYFIKAFEDYPELLNQPNWGASLYFEIHEDEEGSKYVNVRYKNGYEAEQQLLVLGSLGCDSEDCDLEEFTSLIEENLPTDEEWCKECKNTSSRDCRQ